MVIEKIVRKGTYVKEGMVQAAIGRFRSTDFTIIDREAIVSFRSQQEKDACKSELAAKWLNALHRTDPPTWWKTKPTKLGDECDVLAVSSRGEVLAIEVKPHTASDRDIAWSVLQPACTPTSSSDGLTPRAARPTRFCTLWRHNATE